MISTHTLTWSVTPLAAIEIAPVVNFNSHAHVERDINSLLELVILQDFNSHAHVERDDYNSSFSNGDEISTHTLTWSVTL